MEKWEEEREGEREKRNEEEQKERTYSHLHGGQTLTCERLDSTVFGALKYH